jgi:hypothetical protein
VAEADASVAFLQLLHGAFPAAAVMSHSGRLLGTGLARPLSNRFFSKHDEGMSEPFARGRAAFVAATLDAAKPAPKGEVESPDFSTGRSYTSRTYEKIEVDCVVKLPLAGVSEWARDETVGGAGREPFFIGPTDAQRLPLRPAARVPASMARAVAGSSFSDEFYPADAAVYVVAEVYAPLSDGAARLAQKLLQAERVLRFLMAKEGKANVRDCVLGFVFMGPRMDARAGAALYNSLSHYRSILPCLWALRAEPCRLLGFQVDTVPTAVALFQIGASVNALKDSVAALRDELRLLRRRRDCSIA